ncbi:XRE family transcriptional regulator [Paracoccus sp. 1_MG-2023]|uniref:helix-turn-helix domain-containing protein n=1 Tax=unclassified Paracoccus (in: a-proteobacteria) TaxID=2688777 RepID=UPI001C0A5592|nr:MULTISPECIES: XRE family transcriptional regulator [unclassified Paracoccus (in: a-proteobacteria)]MBU2957701.1 XRE family transcriptional regulator [Paracoccus sp. C2R09]MDO6667451.1 XRE family transcriptional regulator [Paracoccus sp. 1_MG-2023]
MSGDKTIGGDIRALRTTRKMTLDDLAGGLGKSIGWLSQVERGLSQPTVDDLQKIARLLEVPTSMFFGTADGPSDEQGLIVRARNRREIGERDSGLFEALLSPDLSDDFEVIHSTFLPGARLDQPRRRGTSEVVYLVSGRLDLWIEDRAFTIETGDSFRIRNAEYRWSNPYDDPATAIWVISPPVY